MIHVEIVHRNAKFIGAADYGSRESGDMWFDPLISEHNAFTATLRKNHAAPMGSFLPQNMPGYRNTRANRSETPRNLTLAMEYDPSDDEDEILSLSVISNKLYPAVIIVGLNSSNEKKAYHLHLPNPLSIAMQSITDYIVGDFNKGNYIVSWAKYIPLVDEHDSTLRIILSDRQDEEFAHCDSITRAVSLHR